MKVFLVRHSHAVDADADLADPQRFLSAKGREIARLVGERLREEGVVFDTVLTSPLVRAVQTAEILVHALGFGQPVQALPSLAPGGSVRRTSEEIAALGVAVACVGHEPSISALGAVLSSQATFPAFRPGQVTLIEGGTPRWTLSPDTRELVPIQ